MATSLAQKLQLKPDQSLALMNAPQGVAGTLSQELPANPLVTLEQDSPAGAWILFVNNLAEALSLVPAALQQVDPNGLVWVAYPKGSSKIKTDINRDILWEALKPTGWRPVRQIAVDDTWSALRYRPADQVGT